VVSFDKKSTMTRSDQFFRITLILETGRETTDLLGNYAYAYAYSP
jgi:hypothetical protein